MPNNQKPPYIIPKTPKASAQDISQFLNQAPDASHEHEFGHDQDEIEVKENRRKRTHRINRAIKEKISINMLSDRVKLIDEVAQDQGIDRSAYINLAIYEKLKKDGFA